MFIVRYAILGNLLTAAWSSSVSSTACPPWLLQSTSCMHLVVCLLQVNTVISRLHLLLRHIDHRYLFDLVMLWCQCALLIDSRCLVIVDVSYQSNSTLVKLSSCHGSLTAVSDTLSV